ncbi:MAG: dicarboxylate/amino acid:cation symporter [Candidatus Marinimicrobia bacterium]|nr:dicarboxylate/amino acid:cation symporter [Candidatus Neomarinimicrobiota bacterium]
MFMKKLKLHWRVLIAMALGTIFALIFKEDALFVAPLGTIFMRLLKMIIVPLILFSITTGVASLGDSKTLGRMGAKTFIYYFVTSIFAILVGLILTNIIQPGVGVEMSGSVQSFDPSSLQKPSSLGGIIIRMIPLNPIAAMADGDMLGVIFWSIVFGFAITRLSGRPQEMLTHFFDYGFQAMMKLTHGIIALLPIGVFGLITKAVATAGFGLFKAVGLYMLTIVSGLLIHWLITLPIIFYLFTRLNPIKHFKAMASAFMTAFSTSSSGATLPVTMDCVENEVGVSNKTTSFVLPLGATINMDGTALYECAGVLFISQVIGFDLNFAQQFVIVLTAFLASVGAAAIPSAGLVMIFVVLDAVGLANHPEVGVIVGTMLAVDRPLDMFRTMVNVTSDSIGAVVIAKTEGETDLYPDK